ncbi:MAG TPA: hypothetical protein VGD78_07560 [Chthoniobacterales bacterium]
MTRPKTGESRGSSAAVPDPRRAQAEREFSLVSDAFASDGEVVYGGGKGFGSTALKVRGKLFALLSSKGKFVVKLPRERVDGLVASGQGVYFDPGHGRLMKEWVALDGAYALWTKLAKEACRFVSGGK